MSKAKIIIILVLLTNTYSSSGQNNCGITVDTFKILLDKNLDDYVAALETEQFQSFNDKKNIPAFIKAQLDCLTKDRFSIANPNEEYRCCCTSLQELPARQLRFFAISDNTLLMIYDTGGWGVFTNILFAKIKGKKIIDIWTGFGSSEFTSTNAVSKFISSKRKEKTSFHGGFVSL